MKHLYSKYLKHMKRIISIIASVLCVCSCSLFDDLGGLDIDEILKPSDYGEFVLQENVIFLSESFENHLDVIDSLTIKIKNSIPEEYIPQNGDIIYCMKTANSPYGFIGRVIGINPGLNSATYRTESVDLTDIFKELHINSSIPIPEDMKYLIDSDGNHIDVTHESSEVWDRITASPQDTSDVANAETKVQASNTVAHTLGIGIENDYFDGKLYVGLSATVNIDISDGKLNDLSYEISRRSGIEGNLKVSRESKKSDKIKILEKTVMLPGAIAVGPLLLTTDLHSEAGFIVNGEVTLQGGMSYEFESCTYRYSYNDGKPIAENLTYNSENNRYFMLSKFEATAGVGMYEEIALEMALYHRNLLALGASAEASFVTSINAEISFDSEELLNLNPSIKVTPELTTGLYCHSKLFMKISGDDERFGMFIRHQLGEFEVKLFPEFINTQTEKINGKIRSTTQLVKNNLVRTKEEGFALFKKNDDTTPLEHKKLEITSTKAGESEGSSTFDIDNPDEYITKPYVIADGKYFYLSDNRWVDLGLPSGILWAAYNVGATSPEEYGGYYAWGETEEKDVYTRENYKYKLRESADEAPIIGTEISGTQYDVAHVKWGDGARMPTLDELVELIIYCTYEVGKYNDINGYNISGPNKNTIFLPFSGIKSDKHKYKYLGSFWSGTCGDFRDHAKDELWGITSPPAYEETSLDIGFEDEDDFYYNWASYFDINENHWLAFVGLPVRPVKDK